MSSLEIKCQKCGERPGTENWVGEGGTLAFVHGLVALWCKVCVLEAQLKYAKDRASQIPNIEKQLLEAKNKEN